MKRLLDGYYRLLQWLVALLLAVLLVPVTMQVLARYTPWLPNYIWTEEISRFAFIWIILLGSIVAVRDESHFAVDVLPSFGESVDRILRGVMLFFMLIAGVVFAWGGWLFAELGLIRRSELAGLPMIAIYSAWPVLGVSWLVFVIEKIVQFLKHNSTKPPAGLMKTELGRIESLPGDRHESA